jgi:hypothetical protein
MYFNFTDRAGNGLIGRAVKFYAVGDTASPLYEATTDNLGRVNLDDYDGQGNSIAEGLYDVKIVAGAEDGSDQWDTRVLISKGKRFCFSDDNLSYVERNANGNLDVIQAGAKVAEIDPNGRISAAGGFNADYP